MSYVQTVNFSFDINCSLQVGDQVYKTATSSLGGFEQSFGSMTIHVGSVFSIISPTSIEVLSEYVDPNTKSRWG